MPRFNYSNEDFLNLLLIYGECGKNISRTCRLFSERYPNKPCPTNQCIRTLLTNCLNFGSFSAKTTKVKPKTDNEELEITVLGYFAAFPNAYYRVQNLLHDDLHRRVEFCEWFLVKLQEEDNFTSKIIWSDEAKFCKNGMYNRHNSHFWSDNNPHVTHVSGFQQSWQFNVFCAVKDCRILCVYFYEENLTGDRYVNIIRNVIQPALRSLPHEESTQAWFQNDGAPAHTTVNVCRLLENIFQDRWIAYNGPTRWPARSPDLTVLDFLYMGVREGSGLRESNNNKRGHASKSKKCI